MSDCPALWISKLQREIVISTTEVEINALAYWCHKSFPVMNMVTNIGTSVGLSTKDIIFMCVSVHKANAGYLVFGINSSAKKCAKEHVLFYKNGVVS